MAAPTLRTLARSLGLSRTTISDALRGSPRVNPETVKRVRAAAEAAGYERNPFTGAVMSLLRRSRGQQFRGVLAALEVVDPDRPAHAARYNDRVLAGVSERAAELGFKVERFEVSAAGVRLNRLDTILHTRGIQAMVILPAKGFPDLSSLSWQRYTAIYVDYFIDRPGLHCVCSDHYRSMIALLQDLHARGYRRPGLFIEIAQDQRLHFRWEGAFLALQKYLPKISAVPPLRVETVTRANFQAWFKKHDPDVVLGHEPGAMAWMTSAGARIPETHAFVCLNSLRTDGSVASIDFQVPLIGARAAELVIGQLLHNEFGVPEHPSLTTIPAKLLEGPTLKPLAKD
jgi:LacI family transcriptional regulator